MTKAEREELRLIEQSASQLVKILAKRGMADFEVTAHAAYIRAELLNLIADSER